MTTLEKAVVCPSETCESIIFYDWGIEVLSNEDTNSITGGTMKRWDGTVKRNTVKICARCLHAYLLEGGDMIDLSDQVGPEEIEMIVQRGRGLMVPPVIRDP